jgi:hypothetical protein
MRFSEKEYSLICEGASELYYQLLCRINMFNYVCERAKNVIARRLGLFTNLAWDPLIATSPREETLHCVKVFI